MSDLGLPERSRIERLLFSPVARALVVSIRPRVADFPIARLYWRKESERWYRRLGKPTTNISYESPVTAIAAPFLFFNVTKYTRLNPDVIKGGSKLRQGKVWGGDWIGVCRADLRSGTVRTILEQDTLQRIAGISGVWVNSLVAAWEDGRGVYAVIGFPKAVNMSTDLTGVGPAKLTEHIDYHLCKLDLQAQQLEVITRLEGTFD